MTDKQFCQAFYEARQYSDPDAFASDVALSDIFSAAIHAPDAGKAVWIVMEVLA